MSKTVLLIAGGSGGHVFPALSIGNALQERGYKVFYFTDVRGKKYFPTTEKNVSLLSTGFAKSLRFSLTFLRQRKITCVWGFGGKLTIAPLVAAWLKRIPRGIHQSDIVLGRANRLLIYLAHALTTGFEKTAHTYKKGVFTGTPVRPEIQPAPYKAWQEGVFHLLVIGGSQGAASLTRLVPQAVLEMPEEVQKNLQITQQCPPALEAEIKATYATTKAHVTLVPFIHDMQKALANAHLVISRAGASSLGEILTVGRPSILIPYPHSHDNHQALNAAFLSDKGAALVIAQQGLTPPTLAANLMSLFQFPYTFVDRAEKARVLGSKDADQAIVRVIEKVQNRNA